MKEDATISSIEKVTPTDVTIKNADGTKTVAPSKMLTKDEKGNLVLNKAAIAPTTPTSTGTTKPPEIPQPGQKVAVVQDSIREASSNFDAEIEITNPTFDPNGPEDENDPNFEYEDITVGVDFDYGYHGKYYPASREEPAEYPELEINVTRVVNLDNGKDITKFVDLNVISQALEDQGYIKSWQELDQSARDEAAIDRYEYDRNYESIDRIKQLSGLK